MENFWNCWFRYLANCSKFFHSLCCFGAIPLEWGTRSHISSAWLYFMGHDWFVYYQPFLATPVDDDNARNSILRIIKNLVKVVRYVPDHVHNLKKHFYTVWRNLNMFLKLSWYIIYCIMFYKQECTRQTSHFQNSIVVAYFCLVAACFCSKNGLVLLLNQFLL